MTECKAKLREDELAKTAQHLELLEAREGAVGLLRTAKAEIKALPGKVWKEKTRATRNSLDYLIRQISGAGTVEKVRKLQELATPLQVEAAQLKAKYEREQRQEEAKEKAAQARKDVQRAKKQETDKLRYFLRRKRSQPGEDLVEILAKLKCLEVHTREHVGNELPEELEQHEPVQVRESVFRPETFGEGLKALTKVVVTRMSDPELADAKNAGV